jgi:hypothetical protein
VIRVAARIVLRREVTRDDIDDAIARKQWRLMNLVPATATHPAQMLLLTEDRSHVLHVVDDAKLGLTYVVPSGPDAERCSREVRDALPTYGEDEIRASLAESAGEKSAEARVLSTKLAALALPAAEADAALRAARTDGDRVVRDAASLALPYLDLPRIAPRPKVSR